jgi:hypothetical protein
MAPTMSSIRSAISMGGVTSFLPHPYSGVNDKLKISARSEGAHGRPIHQIENFKDCCKQRGCAGSGFDQTYLHDGVLGLSCEYTLVKLGGVC